MSVSQPTALGEYLPTLAIPRRCCSRLQCWWGHLNSLAIQSPPEPAGDQSGGNGGFASHVAPADLGKQARRLLDTLTMVTTRLPGLQAAGLTSGQNGELRLDAGRLQAAMAAQPRTITKLFSTMDLNPDEAQPSPSSLPLRPSGSIATPSPLTVLNSALADFQEKRGL